MICNAASPVIEGNKATEYVPAMSCMRVWVCMFVHAVSSVCV